jgi:hypothetical protein
VLHILERACNCLALLDAIDLIQRTCELARVFGIDFFSVLSRGSQYRCIFMYACMHAFTRAYSILSRGSQYKCVCVYTRTFTCTIYNLCTGSKHDGASYSQTEFCSDLAVHQEKRPHTQYRYNRHTSHSSLCASVRVYACVYIYIYMYIYIYIYNTCYAGSRA